MIDIEIEDEAWFAAASNVEDLVEDAAVAALNEIDFGGGAVTILLTDDDSVRDLNARFRGKDYATNVLSFPAERPLGLPKNAKFPLLGDLVMCAPVVAKEATSQKKPLAAHYAHLTVHGCLHLLGWDHEDDADAHAMEQLEREILAGLGIADPYL